MPGARGSCFPKLISLPTEQGGTAIQWTKRVGNRGARKATQHSEPLLATRAHKQALFPWHVYPDFLNSSFNFRTTGSTLSLFHSVSELKTAIVMDGCNSALL